MHNKQLQQQGTEDADDTVSPSGKPEEVAVDHGPGATSNHQKQGTEDADDTVSLGGKPEEVAMDHGPGEFVQFCCPSMCMNLITLQLPLQQPHPPLDKRNKCSTNVELV